MPTARGHTHSLADLLSPKPRKCADHCEAGLSTAGHWGKELAAATCTGRHSFMKSSAWAKDKTPHAQEVLEEKPVAFLTDIRKR